MKISIFQEPAASGSTLMARDYELLMEAANGSQEIIIRFYKWDRPTLSLGYHQKLDILDLERMDAEGVPWVRRPTGGAAVLHSDELTYAIVVPNAGGHGASGLIHELVGRAIADGLCEVGVDAKLDPRGEPLSALPNRTTCFVRTSRWEVTVGGRKMVGSAQRILGSGLLQHGSILTGNDHLRIVDLLKLNSEADRETMRARLAARSTSVEQELGRRVPESEFRQAMEDSFRLVISDLPEQLLATMSTDSE
jgi:lipoyl(octanoyl) transferase